MKKLIKIAAMATCAITGDMVVAQSLNPGWYMGAIGGGGTAGSISFEENPASPIHFTTTPMTSSYNFVHSDGKVKIGLLGDIGLQFGYRYCNWRLEGEALFGGSSTKSVTFNHGAMVLSPENLDPDPIIFAGDSHPFPAVGAPTINQPPLAPIFLLPGTYNTNHSYYDIDNNLTSFKFKQKQVFFAGFLNLYYDFYNADKDPCFVPYLGVGIGAIYVKNKTSIDYESAIAPVVPDTMVPVKYSASFSDSFTTSAAQGIIGVTYLIDDYSNIALDFRYLATQAISQFDDQRLNAYTVNLVFNYTFDTED